MVERAEAFRDIIIPGFTHLQHAQPILLAHLLLAYVEMLGRDRRRLSDCRKGLNVNPLGAGALAGTALPIDVQFTTKELGFEAPFNNSIDAVSDRDFIVEFVFDLSLIACHLSRLAEEWLLWASPEFDFIDLDESFCTGSSIMPQKKNPDVLELIRGKTGRVYGSLVELLTLLKGLPLAYNRDLQEDKAPLFDASDQVKACLAVLAELIARTTFKEQKMREACERGYLDATALADYLVGRGLPFRDAHKVVGAIVRKAAAQNVRLSDLTLEELRTFSELIAEDVYHFLGARNCVDNYRSHGSSSPAEVERQLKGWKELLFPAEPS
jgi:argininosuccinate lyase